MTLRKQPRCRAGVTLTEVLIVTAILAVLSAVLWMVLRPAAIHRGRVASVTTGLRSAISAFNIYRADNNDAYPGNWQQMGMAKTYFSEKLDSIVTVDAPPEYPASWESRKNLIRSQNTETLPLKLMLVVSAIVQTQFRRYSPRTPFDESSHGLITAKFMVEPVEKRGSYTVWFGENYDSITRVLPYQRELAAFGDGHVAFQVPTYFSDWFNELEYQRKWKGIR
jgi:prepilin-type N-terminal cleavage/methylation domain-containing protein